MRLDIIINISTNLQRIKQGIFVRISHFDVK
jgi:hypothetical protein